MIFFCPYCKGALESCGYVNKLLCLKCRCIFLVKVELQELKGPDVDANIRQLASSSAASDDAADPDQEPVSDGPDACRQSDMPEGHPI